MKRKHLYKGTKRSIAYNVLTGYYTIEQAARNVCVQPATVKRWLDTFGRDVLAPAVPQEELSQPIDAASR